MIKIVYAPPFSGKTCAWADFVLQEPEAQRRVHYVDTDSLFILWEDFKWETSWSQPTRRERGLTDPGVGLCRWLERMTSGDRPIPRSDWLVFTNLGGWYNAAKATDGRIKVLGFYRPSLRDYHFAFGRPVPEGWDIPTSPVDLPNTEWVCIPRLKEISTDAFCRQKLHDFIMEDLCF